MEGRLQTHDGQKTRSQWRLNANLLCLKPFQTTIEKEIVEYLKINSDCGVTPQCVWDALKVVIRGKLISMTSAHYKQKRKYKEELLHKIASLEQQHKQSCSPKIFRALLEERKKLEHIEVSQIKKKISCFSGRSTGFAHPKR